MIPLSTTAIIIILVAVVAGVALVIGLLSGRRRQALGGSRRQGLQQRFGPEYDRLVTERDSRQAAEAELAERERRVRGLDIRPLTEVTRERYANQWPAIQELFVDAPADAVAAAQALIIAVVAERGYPTEDHDQMLADLSVAHAAILDHYRAADEISRRAAPGAASTEDLRLAMIHYREFFRGLLGEPADAGPGPAGSAGQQDEMQAADVQPSVADGAIADPREDGSAHRMPRS